MHPKQIDEYDVERSVRWQTRAVIAAAVIVLVLWASALYPLGFAP